MQHIWGTGEVLTGFWWEKFGTRNHFKYTGVDGRITLNSFLKNTVV